MTGKKRLFGTNGIRGVVNEELTIEKTMKIGGAIGTFFKKGTLIVGYDARTSGPMLVKAVISGLNAVGCNVILAGMAPTPAIQYAAKKKKVDGAVIVTASHNPPQYNGIKVIWNDGIEISRKQEAQIEKIFFEDLLEKAKWHNLGRVSQLSTVINEYIQGVKQHINTTEILGKGYHLVIDPANSVGALVAPRLSRELGCKVTTINADIDGTFPGRLPEPHPDNLKTLALTVQAVNADLGVAFDGDADRAIFADENGKVHWGDRTFALIEKYFLEDNPNEKIVTPVSSSTLIKDVADLYESEIIWTKVGSVTVSHTMKKTKAKLGGEENGGVFYGPHQSVRDGTMTVALILDIMTKTDEKLSRLLDNLPKYSIKKGIVHCEHVLKGKVLEVLIKETKGFNVSTIDGVKIWFDDKSSILMRPSGTEPIYRLYAEAKIEDRASQLVQEYSLKLERIIDKLKH
jgi:phosphomannomutase/phosphoglucomutase